MLPGEEQVMRLNKLKCEVPAFLRVPVIEGDIIMTNYKMVFRPTWLTNGSPLKTLPHFMNDYFTLPLSLIQRFEKKIVETKKQNVKYYQCSLELTTKDYRSMRFDFEGRLEDCQNSFQRVQLFAFPENEMQDIFAFQYSFPVASNVEQEYLENGWNLWDAEREFKIDQGLDFDSPTCVRIFFYINKL